MANDETQCSEALCLNEMQRIAEADTHQTYGGLPGDGEQSSPEVNDDTKVLPVPDASSLLETPTTPASARAGSFPATLNPKLVLLYVFQFQKLVKIRRH